MDQKPAAELKQDNDIYVLYRNVVKNQIPYDLMTIEYATGNTDSVVFYDSDGEKKMMRVRQGFDVVQGSVSATPTFSNFLEAVSPQDSIRLNAPYNKLLDISNNKIK